MNSISRSAKKQREINPDKCEIVPGGNIVRVYMKLNIKSPDTAPKPKAFMSTVKCQYGPHFM